MTLMTNEHDWIARAECRDAPPDLFFPEGGPGGRRIRAAIAEAVTICRACPVITECARYARTEKVTHGIWAGRDLDAKRRRTARDNYHEKRQNRP